MAKTLQDEISELGGRGYYQEQAERFCERTNTRIMLRYVGMKPHFTDSDEPRDTWEFSIKRGAREHTGVFGDSTKNTEDRIARMLRNDASYAHNVRLGRKTPPMEYSIRSKRWEALSREWGAEGFGDRPTAYNILACMTTNAPQDDIDDFAAEYGYTKPSEAIKVFAAVQKEWKAMQALYTDEELEALQEIS